MDSLNNKTYFGHEFAIGDKPAVRKDLDVAGRYQQYADDNRLKPYPAHGDGPGAGQNRWALNNIGATVLYLENGSVHSKGGKTGSQWQEVLPEGSINVSELPHPNRVSDDARLSTEQFLAQIGAKLGPAAN